ncbi:hypothetical protein XA68_17401 [Ophiocordyceps unilateralis]|uniref:Uncharacterized protein n=1 Tax=Ophiocordyceps unilateralis TaxID=268505 RepID=A0A2A9PIU4_OPHUN|nr:hypothetical protein XA68_17401 [Ophiocordyceps unilateralis]
MELRDCPHNLNGGWTLIVAILYIVSRGPSLPADSHSVRLRLRIGRSPRSGPDSMTRRHESTGRIDPYVG